MHTALHRWQVANGSNFVACRDPKFERSLPPPPEVHSRNLAPRQFEYRHHGGATPRTPGLLRRPHSQPLLQTRRRTDANGPFCHSFLQPENIEKTVRFVRFGPPIGSGAPASGVGREKFGDASTRLDLGAFFPRALSSQLKQRDSHQSDGRSVFGKQAVSDPRIHLVGY